MEDLTQKDPSGPITTGPTNQEKSSYEERKFSFAILYFYIVVLTLVLIIWGYQQFIRFRNIKSGKSGG